MAQATGNNGTIRTTKLIKVYKGTKLPVLDANGNKIIEDNVPSHPSYVPDRIDLCDCPVDDVGTGCVPTTTVQPTTTGMTTITTQPTTTQSICSIVLSWNTPNILCNANGTTTITLSVSGNNGYQVQFWDTNLGMFVDGNTSNSYTYVVASNGQTLSVHARIKGCINEIEYFIQACSPNGTTGTTSTTPPTTVSTTQATTQATTSGTTQATTQNTTQGTTQGTTSGTTQGTTSSTTQETTQATTQGTTQSTTAGTTAATTTQGTTASTTAGTTQATTTAGTTQVTTTQATTTQGTTTQNTTTQTPVLTFNANYVCVNDEERIEISNMAGGSGSNQYSVDGGNNWTPITSSVFQFNVTANTNVSLIVRDIVNPSIYGTANVSVGECASTTGTTTEKLVWNMRLCSDNSNATFQVDNDNLTSGVCLYDNDSGHCYYLVNKGAIVAPLITNYYEESDCPTCLNSHSGTTTTTMNTTTTQETTNTTQKLVWNLQLCSDNSNATYQVDNDNLTAGVCIYDNNSGHCYYTVNKGAIVAPLLTNYYEETDCPTCLANHSNTTTTTGTTTTVGTTETTTVKLVWNLKLCSNNNDATLQVDNDNLTSGVCLYNNDNGECYYTVNKGAIVAPLMTNYFEETDCATCLSNHNTTAVTTTIDTTTTTSTPLTVWRLERCDNGSPAFFEIDNPNLSIGVCILNLDNDTCYTITGSNAQTSALLFNYSEESDCASCISAGHN